MPQNRKVRRNNLRLARARLKLPFVADVVVDADGLPSVVAHPMSKDAEKATHGQPQ